MKLTEAKSAGITEQHQEQITRLRQEAKILTETAAKSSERELESRLLLVAAQSENEQPDDCRLPRQRQMEAIRTPHLRLHPRSQRQPPQNRLGSDHKQSHAFKQMGPNEECSELQWAHQRFTLMLANSRLPPAFIKLDTRT